MTTAELARRLDLPIAGLLAELRKAGRVEPSSAGWGCPWRLTPATATCFDRSTTTCSTLRGAQ